MHLLKKASETSFYGKYKVEAVKMKNPTRFSVLKFSQRIGSLLLIIRLMIIIAGRCKTFVRNQAMIETSMANIS